MLGFGLGLGALLEDGAMGDRQLEQLEHRHHLVGIRVGVGVGVAVGLGLGLGIGARVGVGLPL